MVRSIGTATVSAVLALVLGLAAIGGAVYIGWDFDQDYQGALSADGVVTSLNAGGSHPEIEFTTATGETVSYPQGGMIFGYQPGDRVRVLYLPSAPRETATLDAFGARYSWACFLGAAGCMPLVLGVVMLIWLRRPKGDDGIRARLRWQEHGPVARMRPQRIRIAGSLGIGVALLALARFVMPGAYTWATGGGMVAWGLYLAFVRVTRISFERQWLLVESGWGSKRLEISFETIMRFEPRADVGNAVFAVSADGTAARVPITLDPINLVSRPGNRPAFPAPIEYAEFVARRMNVMFAAARRAS
jgi:hypothetical protein